MRVVIRADAAITIGTGHVMRCLTLAEALRAQGVGAQFVCAETPGHMVDAIRTRGFACTLIPVTDEAGDASRTAELVREAGASRVLVDHYGVGPAWEAAMPTPVMAIDDMARPHDCDFLLDQNLGTTPGDYAPHAPSDCQLLIGPRYALLRPEFAAARADALAGRARRTLREILVTMGGTDPGNATGWALQALGDLAPELRPRDLRVTVVLGPAAPHLDAVRAALPTLPFETELMVGTDRMAALMARADLAIGAAGSTSWERCCLGLPTITTVLADNQAGIAGALSAAGAAHAVSVGDTPALQAALTALASPAALSAAANRAADVCDGHGAARVAAEVVAGRRAHIWPDPRRISVVVDPPGGWFDDHAEALVGGLRAAGQSAQVVNDQTQVPEGHLAYYLSCTRITPPELLARNPHNVVVHASDLPRGRGMSPLVWQILDGRHEIPLSMIAMSQAMDEGDILAQGTLRFGGHELNDEMREAMGAAIVEMCLTHALAPAPAPGRPQYGEPSYYGRRRAADSRIDPEASLADQFDLLRVVDNERYPAFFDHRGHRYALRIERLGPTPEDDRTQTLNPVPASQSSEAP